MRPYAKMKCKKPIKYKFFVAKANCTFNGMPIASSIFKMTEW